MMRLRSLLLICGVVPSAGFCAELFHASAVHAQTPQEKIVRPGPASVQPACEPLKCTTKFKLTSPFCRTYSPPINRGR